MRLIPGISAFGLLLGLWLGLVHLGELPPYLLPGPERVLVALWTFHLELGRAALRTGAEIVTGFALGAGAGAALAMAMAEWRGLANSLRPVLLVSQTIPIFALAPLLTLWLGFGIAPKVVVTALICFFPVASAFYDGLLRTPPAMLDLAGVMGARPGAVLWQLRLPAARPALASGLRLAAVYAPVGAVVGEWVGGSDGLGALMIHANGRMRTDLVFAALAVLVVLALGFTKLVEHALARPLSRHADGIAA